MSIRRVAGRGLCCTLGLCALAAQAGAETLWHVDQTVCPVVGNGSDSEPFCRIQSAIEAAADQDTVLVAPGVYLENINFLGKAIEVVAAAGPELTTIEAASAQRTVRFGNGETSNSLLEGFTITGPNGGIACDGSNPTIRDCIIQNCAAETGAGIECFNASPTIDSCTLRDNVAGNIGGGININNQSHPLLLDTLIQGNEAAHGAGMYIVNGSSPQIHRCRIQRNIASGSGGGVSSAGADSAPLFVDCLFWQNEAVAGGGINCGNSSPTFRQCEISQNIAIDIGGGFNCKDHSSPLIEDCDIVFNSARQFNGGGLVLNLFSHATIRGCLITNNEAVNGAGLYVFDRSRPTITDTYIYQNSAAEYAGGMAVSAQSHLTMDRCVLGENLSVGSAGGIGFSDSSGTVSHTILFHNSAFDGPGGGILCNASAPSFTSCEFFGNGAIVGDAVYCYDRADPELVNCTLMQNGPNPVFAGLHSRPTLNSCILWDFLDFDLQAVDTSVIDVAFSDIRGGYPGAGNIDLDPLFLPGQGFRLQGASPCVDTGDPNLAYDESDTDLLGLRRVVGPRVDRGAYELSLHRWKLRHARHPLRNK